MEDVHCLKRRSMTARVGCLFQQCFSFFFSVFLQTAVLMVHMILIMCMMDFE